VRPGPIPNPEVKPVFAAVLLTCVSGWEAAVLALDLIHISEKRRVLQLKHAIFQFLSKKSFLGTNTWIDIEIYTITNLTRNQ
jgi:hypothetical protein